MFWVKPQPALKIRPLSKCSFYSRSSLSMHYLLLSLYIVFFTLFFLHGSLVYPMFLLCYMYTYSVNTTRLKLSCILNTCYFSWASFQYVTQYIIQLFLSISLSRKLRHLQFPILGFLFLMLMSLEKQETGPVSAVG